MFELTTNTITTEVYTIILTRIPEIKYKLLIFEEVFAIEYIPYGS
jgi:hypothetical protein